MIRILIAESETAEERQQRRDSVGRSAGETYADTIRAILPDARCESVRPHEEGSEAAMPLDAYDAVFLCGSPLHTYEDTPEVRRQIAFARAVFATGTPSIGSCAGLQLAVAAAGGVTRRSPAGHEVGFARRITATAAGREHPLLRGRPAAWDAAAIHGDEVETLPAGAVLLAGNAACAVQAAEVRHGSGVFWGVQYHPELPLTEIAAALRRQADTITGEGWLDRDGLEAQAALIEALGREPDRVDLAWRLGVNEEIAQAERRQTELRNAVAHLILPARAARGRA